MVSRTITRGDLASERDRIVPRLGLPELRHIVDQAPVAVEIFGPTVAAEAIRAGLVHEFRLFVVPKIVGGGLRALPDGVRLDLRLADHRVFEDSTVYLRYVAP